MRYQTLLEFDNAQYYLRYTNDDKFGYDTRAYKSEYTSKFDTAGNRIVNYSVSEDCEEDKNAYKKSAKTNKTINAQ